MHDPRIVRELLRQREPGVAEREQDVPEDAVPLELEAAIDRAHMVDALPAHALVPAALLAQLRDVLEEQVDRRVVAVADAPDERHGRPAPYGVPNRESREGGRQAVPVALRAHRALADCSRPPAPDRGGIRIRVEDCDLVRLDAAVQEGQVRDEAGEAAADDRNAHFTLPASNPCTK